MGNMVVRGCFGGGKEKRFPPWSMHNGYTSRLARGHQVGLGSVLELPAEATRQNARMARQGESSYLGICMIARYLVMVARVVWCVCAWLQGSAGAERAGFGMQTEGGGKKGIEIGGIAASGREDEFCFKRPKGRGEREESEERGDEA